MMRKSGEFVKKVAFEMGPSNHGTPSLDEAAERPAGRSPSVGVFSFIKRARPPPASVPQTGPVAVETVPEIDRR